MFRPYVADRTALTLLNNGMLKPKDFVIKENSAVFLDEAGRKKVLTYWQTKKKESIRHPVLDKKVEIGLLPYAQALLLAHDSRRAGRISTVYCKVGGRDAGLGNVRRKCRGE